MSEITFFLPVRKGSVRVVNKNLRQFSGFKGGLLELKLRQLLRTKKISRVLLSTNDDEAIHLAEQIDPASRLIEIVVRPGYLCLDSTPLQALIEYVPSVVGTPHILWGHTTTPFVSEHDYDTAVDIYWKKLREGYDTLISASPFQNFLFREGHPGIYNYDQQVTRWPRTQDLPKLYEVNHAMFITGRQVYLSKRDRVGDAIYFYEMDRLKSFDIDWQEDFLMAEAIYDRLFKVHDHSLGL